MKTGAFGQFQYPTVPLRVDLDRLRLLSAPWPGGAQR
jgi:hypothetical protein